MDISKDKLLIEHLVIRFNVSESEAAELFGSILSDILKRLSSGESVYVDGFGVFELKSYSGRRTVSFILDETRYPLKESLKNESNNKLSDAFFDELRKTLQSEEEVGLGVLGSFRCRSSVSGGRKITFIPSLTLRKSLESNLVEDTIVPEQEPVLSDTQSEKPETIEVKQEELILPPISNSKEEESKKPITPVTKAPKKILNNKATGSDDILQSSKRMHYARYAIVGLLALIPIIILFLSISDDKEKSSDNLDTKKTMLVAGTPESRLSAQNINIVADSSCLGVEVLLPEANLSLLSEKYYGNSCYWVYIFLENRDQLNLPTVSQAGMRLRIPDLNKLGINPEDSLSVQKALQLGVDLIKGVK